MNRDAVMYVAGHAGLIGSAVVRRLEREGYRTPITRRRSQLDLQDAGQVSAFFEEVHPEYVVLAAGRVGGIMENQTFPADFMDENMAVQLNVLKAARRAGVRRLILFGSSCMYPRECPQPMAEDALLSGRPEPTSLPYAISKLAGTYLCLSYNKQDRETRFIPVIPNSAYGPHDNFDPKSAHVLSSLMARFHQAKVNGAESVTLWGSGSPRREFIHADDIADACVHLLGQDDLTVELPINIGVGQDVSIKELAELIAGVVGYQGELKWDSTKPDGAPRKLLDSARIQSLGWKPKIGLHEGLAETYQWYARHVETASASLQEVRG
ncbi:MAG: GDP-fucose synthetase [Nitrospira sp. SG-bin1]|nr:MAG: GDP-fucose synthetase [Nitrospira sp. SG-bin1]